VEITSCILSPHNAKKLELSNKKTSRKHANNLRLNNTLLNNQWVIVEIKRKLGSQASWKLMKMKTQPTRTYGTSKSNAKRKVYNHEYIYYKNRKISNK
jgi:hypothetical protein